MATITDGRRPVGRPRQPTTPILEPGLSIWSGQLREEYLNELKPWSRAVKIYQEMQDDVVIGALFESIKTPLLASPFEVVAASNSSSDMAAKEFLEANLFQMPELEWTQHVEEMIEFLDMGWSLSEKVLEKRRDGMLYLRALVPIGQDTLDAWGEVDDLGRVSSFRQRDKNNRLRTAPMPKLLHFTFRGRKRNPQGRGILRSLYRPWFFKKNLEALEAIGAERDVGNAPVAKLDPERKYSSSDLTDLQNALKGFRMDEALYVILPGGVELEAYGGGNKIYDIRSMIKDWQHLIRQRFFADFLSFGTEGVGTQALAREMTTFFGLALRSIQEAMLSVWNRQLTPWLFKWNGWDGQSPLPKLDWLRPGDTNLQSLAQSYSTLIGAGMLDATDVELRNRIRVQLGLKKMEGPSASPVPVGQPTEPATPSQGVQANATRPPSQPVTQVSEPSSRRVLPFVTAWDANYVKEDDDDDDSAEMMGLAAIAKDITKTVKRGKLTPAAGLQRLIVAIQFAMMRGANAKTLAIMEREKARIRELETNLSESSDSWEFAHLGDSLSAIVDALIAMVRDNQLSRSEAFQALQDLQQRRGLTGDRDEVTVELERLTKALWPQDEADLLLGRKPAGRP